MTDVGNDSMRQGGGTRMVAENNDKPIMTARDGDDQRPSSTIEPGLSDDINDLKKRILELEARQVKVGRAGPEQMATDPKIMDDMEQYKRMEACLYKHRKEWELNVGPGGWSGHFEYSRSLNFNGKHWPIISTGLNTDRKYKRPDIFDPAHEYGPNGAAQPSEAGKIGKDDYDMTIDWGNRRD